MLKPVFYAGEMPMISNRRKADVFLRVDVRKSEHRALDG